MSAFVKRTPAIGVLRGPAAAGLSGCSCGMVSICRAKSGDALIRKQHREAFESLLTPMLDCVCGTIFPLRAATQFAQAQFHWGRPPPAALPRMWIRINRSSAAITSLGSHRARVTRALKKDRHGFQHRFDPALFGSSHESQRFHRCMSDEGQIIFR